MRGNDERIRLAGADISRSAGYGATFAGRGRSDPGNFAGVSDIVRPYPENKKMFSRKFCLNKCVACEGTSWKFREINKGDDA